MIHRPLLSVAVLLLVCITSNLFAQLPEHLRPESVLLSVYNTGNKYRLTPASFAPRTPRTELLTDMVWINDTLVKFEDTGRTATMPPNILAKMPDSIRQKFLRQREMKAVVSRKCDKPMLKSEVEGKVVIMELGVCDASLKALMAQRAGAKAIVLVHFNNSPTNIQVNWGRYQDSLKIPCYTVRKDIGKRISAMLPSKVGIKRPDTMPSDVEALRRFFSGDTTNQSQQTKDYVNSLFNSNQLTLTDGARYTWRVSPNPTSDFTTLEYLFAKPTDFTIEVFNENGQPMQRESLNAAQSGSIDVGESDWASGVYTVHLIPKGSKPTVKKLVIQR